MVPQLALRLGLCLPHWSIKLSWKWVLPSTACAGNTFEDLQIKPRIAASFGPLSAAGWGSQVAGLVLQPAPLPWLLLFPLPCFLLFPCHLRSLQTVWRVWALLYSRESKKDLEVATSLLFTVFPCILGVIWTNSGLVKQGFKPQRMTLMGSKGIKLLLMLKQPKRKK